MAREQEEAESRDRRRGEEREREARARENRIRKLLEEENRRFFIATQVFAPIEVEIFNVIDCG